MSVLVVGGGLALVFHLPGDISGMVLPKRDADRVREIFLHGEFETKLPDGTAAVDKRFRVPTAIVTPAPETSAASPETSADAEASASSPEAVAVRTRQDLELSRAAVRGQDRE